MVEMVRVASEHEFARFQSAHLRHHQGERRVRGDVERHTEKDIGTALVHLAGQAPSAT
jgi:hypothetical protein